MRGEVTTVALGLTADWLLAGAQPAGAGGFIYIYIYNLGLPGAPGRADTHNKHNKHLGNPSTDVL